MRGAYTLLGVFDTSDALQAHARMPDGRVFIHLVDTPDEHPDADYGDEAARTRAYRSFQRQSEQARRLGMSYNAYCRARKAGLLPAWCYERAKRCDAGAGK